MPRSSTLSWKKRIEPEGTGRGGCEVGSRKWLRLGKPVVPPELVFSADEGLERLGEATGREGIGVGKAAGVGGAAEAAR